MTFNSKEEVRSAWDRLKAEEREYLENAYEEVKEALRADGSDPRDISTLESLEEYAENKIGRAVQQECRGEGFLSLRYKNKIGFQLEARRVET